MATLLEDRQERSTTLWGQPVRPIFAGERKAQRETYGDYTSLIEAAREEADDGKLANAWTLYEQALAAWMRQRWIEHSGKPGSPFRRVEQLAPKLVSARVIDKWLADAVTMLRRRPRPVRYVHLDLLAALVTSLTLEGVSCRP